jgi:hypothetical protein
MTTSMIRLIVTTFIDGIYNFILETNHVSSVYTVVAVLCLKILLHVMLLHMVNMLYAFTLVCCSSSSCCC